MKDSEKNIDDRPCHNESFGTLLRIERKKQGVTMAGLAAGFADEGIISRFESGEREPDASTMTRLTDRLGMEFEDEGAYLFYDDYEEWQRRWSIIKAIENNELCQADRLLVEYALIYNGNAVRQQFGKVMEAQCISKRSNCGDRKGKRYDSAAQDKIKALYYEAAELTIPQKALKCLEGIWLSVDEINIVLESRFHCGNAFEKGDMNVCAGLYEEILQYIYQPRFSIPAKAKIYPKTVVYMYRRLHEYSNEQNFFEYMPEEVLRRLYSYCENALDMLREDAVRYYLTELLEMRLEFLENGFGGRQTEKLTEQTREWLSAVYSLCREYGISEYTEDSCYFYKENNVYNIGDVIRNRRRMLGMTMEQLYTGICSEKTLRRLEHNRAKTHRDIAEELLGRLGLPAGYQRMGIITNDRKAIELYNKYKKLSGEFEYEKCMEILLELERLLSDNLVNRQFIFRAKMAVMKELNEIGDDEYKKKMIEFLEQNALTNDILCGDNFYVSEMEKMSLYVVSREYKLEGDYIAAFKYIEPIYNKLMLLTDEDIEKNISDYEFFMTYTAILLGSMGEYEKSNIISRSVIKGQLAYGRVHMIHRNLASMAWNEHKQNENKKAYKDSLYQCMLWSQLCKKHFFERTYYDIMSVSESTCLHD